MLYNYLFVQELGADEDYLINFVMQISRRVYLTAPFVKTDLILIFPGRLKRMLLPASASEGLCLETHFSDSDKTITRRKTKKEHNARKALAVSIQPQPASEQTHNCSLFSRPSGARK